MDKKVAIVTGSSRGIGKAIAIRLAKEGYNIVINYNSSESEALKVTNEVKSFGVEAIMVKADVTKYKEVENLFNESVGKFGKIDLLVNNAGKVDDCYLMMLSSNTLDKLVDINLKSVYYCCKQAAIRMCKKGGKIINVSSVAAIKGMIGQSVYSGTKGAINSMTAVLAKELIQFGIIVNAVAPGFIDTNMTEKFTLEKRKKYEEMIPAKRFGRSEDIANLVAYLASNISDYIVGQVIYVDGGLSI